MRRRGRGAGPAPAAGGTQPPGSGGREPIRGCPAYLGPPPSDPTAPYYGGAAVKAGSGSGEGRTRLTREGQKLDRRQVRNGDPTADKSGGSRPIERRTFRSNPDAGSKGRPSRRCLRQLPG